MRAHRAIDAAFEDMMLIHRRMSFHEASSDVSRLNRDAVDHPVVVHHHTLEVLRWARQIAAASRGGFDITVAPQLVAWGLLPSPKGRHRADPDGSWRDVELLADGRVRFHRPVWIDLGGIAKGYAVDCAIERLRTYDVAQACVNAGGDLRVLGPQPELVFLRPASRWHDAIPVVEIQSGSVASSSGHLGRRRHRKGFHGPHVHPVQRCPVGTHSFACVVAARCIVADALTKVALVQGRRSDDVLRRYAARAYIHSARHGWRTFGAQA
jgi:thiamine biosynthesis lipoprotein